MRCQSAPRQQLGLAGGERNARCCGVKVLACPCWEGQPSMVAREKPEVAEQEASKNRSSSASFKGSGLAGYTGTIGRGSLSWLCLQKSETAAGENTPSPVLAGCSRAVAAATSLCAISAQSEPPPGDPRTWHAANGCDASESFMHNPTAVQCLQESPQSPPLLGPCAHRDSAGVSQPI